MKHKNNNRGSRRWTKSYIVGKINIKEEGFPLVKAVTHGTISVVQMNDRCFRIDVKIIASTLWWCHFFWKLDYGAHFWIAKKHSEIIASKKNGKMHEVPVEFPKKKNEKNKKERIEKLGGVVERSAAQPIDLVQ